MPLGPWPTRAIKVWSVTVHVNGGCAQGGRSVPGDVSEVHGLSLPQSSWGGHVFTTPGAPRSPHLQSSGSMVTVAGPGMHTVHSSDLSLSLSHEGDVSDGNQRPQTRHRFGFSYFLVGTALGSPPCTGSA